MKHSIDRHMIKVELNSQQQLHLLLDLVYSTTNAFTIELNFTDLNSDIETRYVRCYLIFQVEEDAKLIHKKLSSTK